jgi:aspartate/methionine/tyrosine aminotransferase
MFAAPKPCTNDQDESMNDLDSLPDLPWDTLTAFTATARSHPEGMVDLSMGSPVDPTPEVIRRALVASTDAHSYPQVAGTPALRAAIAQWYARRRDVPDLVDAEVLPTIGSKELIAGLPTWLGLGAGDTVVYPSAAYPTYAVGAALAGASALASDDPAAWPASTRLIWLNSPRNPDGRVLGIEQLRAAEVGSWALSSRETSATPNSGGRAHGPPAPPPASSTHASPERPDKASSASTR